MLGCLIGLSIDTIIEIFTKILWFGCSFFSFLDACFLSHASILSSIYFSDLKCDSLPGRGRSQIVYNLPIDKSVTL
jgi:hypothetical protein